MTRSYLYFGHDPTIPLKEVAIPNEKSSPKWVLPFLAVVAVWFGAVTIYAFVRGETPEWLEVALFVMFAALAIERWLKNRKDADKQ
ncbi:hypothetical protein ACFL3B_03535 [Gemmatimonadota bacterium]